MKTVTSKDWAQELIAEMQANHIADCDVATKAFVSAYQNGDTEAALEVFWAAAEKRYDVERETLLVFADGSAYVGWQQGIDRFYPDMEMVREQYPDELAALGI